MIVLKIMLDRGINDWFKPITPIEVAPHFHAYLMEKEYRKKIDFSDKANRKLWEYDEKKMSRLIAEMPMTKWSEQSNGLVTFKKGIFTINIDVRQEDREILYHWTREICEYNLHYHFFVRKNLVKKRKK